MLAAAPFIIILAAWAADKLWPLPLQEVYPARVVVAQDGTPLWRFADADGIWRYPVTIEDVSPRYLEALINYEDRWFWKHPGVNPFSVARAAWQDLTSGRVISGGSTLTMQVARLLDPHPKTFGGKIRQLWRASPHWHGKRAPAMAIVMPGRLGLTLAMSLGSGLADRTARPLLVSLALPVPYRC